MSRNVRNPPALAVGRFKGLLFLAVLGCVFGVYCSPLKEWLDSIQVVREWLLNRGLAAPVFVVLGTAVLTMVGAPRLVLCALAGAVLGFSWGLIWSQLGGLLGSYFVFLFVRWSGRAYAVKKWPKLDRFSEPIEERGLFAVFLIRQMPMNGFYNNVFLGLTSVSHKDFLLGSGLGFLPAAIPAILVGAGLIQASLVEVAEYALIAVFCLAAFGFALKWLLPSTDSPMVKTKSADDAR